MKAGKIFLSILTCVCYAQIACAQTTDTITWGMPDFKPFAIPNGTGKDTGITDHVRLLLQSKLTEYQHKNVEASIPRITREIQTRKNWCWVGALKSAERESFAHFSLPQAMVLPQQIIVHRDTVSRFLPPPGETQSLGRLLESKAFRTATLLGRSYGPKIDTLFSIHSQNTYATIPSALEQVLNHQLDFVIEYPLIANYHADSRGRPGELIALPFDEMSSVLMSYVICPRTEWGKKVIWRIDEILLNERPTPKYRKFVELWSDAEQVATLRKNYSYFLSAK